MIQISIEDVVPMGAVRMTRRGKFTSETAQKYLGYKHTLSTIMKAHMKSKELLQGKLEVKITFFMPIPNSWSMKKKSEIKFSPHVSKPDIDNLVKGVFDAANKIVWKDDGQVHRVTSKKIYSSFPGIMLEVYES